MQDFNSPNAKTALGLDANVAALLCNILAPICCLGVILSIIILVQEKTNSFVRFYAAQAIFTWLALFVLNLVVGIPAGFMAGAMNAPALANLVSLLLMAIAIGVFVYLGINAYQGKILELPVIGGIARSISNK
jgi:uncharacterized membrane protein